MTQQNEGADQPEIESSSLPHSPAVTAEQKEPSGGAGDISQDVVDVSSEKQIEDVSFVSLSHSLTSR